MEYTGSSEYELTMCMERMAEKLAEETVTPSGRTLNAVKKKWKNEQHFQVSTKLEFPNIFYVLEASVW